MSNGSIIIESYFVVKATVISLNFLISVILGQYRILRSSSNTYNGAFDDGEREKDAHGYRSPP